MAEGETLEAVAAELDQLPAGHRRQVLAALTVAERTTLDRLLKPALAAVDSRAAADLAPCFSPWLGTRLRQAEAGTGPMTAAARRHLLRAAGEAIEDTPVTDRPDPGRRSLLQALFDALGPRRAAS